jgi:hypothetical protein
MILNGKTVDYATLKAELIAAGIAMPHDLGQDGDDLHTYDDDGVNLDLPAEAATVIAAHVPPEPETPAPVILRAIWQDTPFDDTAHAVIDALLAYLGG